MPKMYTHPDLSFHMLVCSSTAPEYLQFRNKGAGDKPGMIFLKGISNEGCKRKKYEHLYIIASKTLNLVPLGK